MALKSLIFLASIIATGITQYADFQSYVNMVQGNITLSQNYVLPVNNDKLVAVDQNTIFDYGVFDFIIVGAGSAGTLLANRLTEILGWKVLLLEAGGDENDFSAIPGMSFYLQNSDMNWGYYTIPQTTCCLGMRNNSCVAPRGKVLGGSSVINAKMYVRGNRADYDYWEQLGNLGWSYYNVLPYFIKTENTTISNPDFGFHGTRGPLHVQYTERSIFTTSFLNAERELGVPERDYNGLNQFVASPIQFNINGLQISSGRRAFIDPIRNRTNLNITLNAFVTKLLIDPVTKVATGVEFIHNRTRFQARAAKEVISSAGAYNSPQLLMLSGIGPRDELTSLSIPIIQELPVGQNFEEHPVFVGFIVKTNQTQYNESLQEALSQYLQGHRPLTNPMNADSLRFVKVNNGNLFLGLLNDLTQILTQPAPNIQHILVVPPGFYNGFGPGFNFNDEITQSINANYNPYSDMIVFVILLHSKSHGNVTLKSTNPKDFPNIDYRMFSDPNNIDIETMYQGILEAFKLLDTQAFRAINATFVPVVKGCGEYVKTCRNYWYCTIRHMTSTIYHPMGTTRMGTTSINSVVTSELKVHGVNKLRVIDAGSMPYMPSGNINAGVYLIAEKAADIIKGNYGVL